MCWLQIENVFATMQVYLAERRVVLGLEVSLEKLTSVLLILETVTTALWK